MLPQQMEKLKFEGPGNPCFPMCMSEAAHEEVPHTYSSSEELYVSECIQMECIRMYPIG